ncbi:MAG: SGNH/GDSL hydrolase family protein [Actinomycetota bacterium]|nr:SGNH/GDSL hydrolase family protein [Actinomycetota bacterium]
MEARRLALVLLLLVLVAAACTRSRPEVLPPPEDTGPPPVYVAVGASETTGVGSEQPLRDAWPRVFHRTALPPGSVLVNMGIPGATVAQTLAEAVDPARAAKPNLVTVWLNVNDMNRGVGVAEYERQLDTLVRALRGGGSTRVLVANTPPLDHLPAYQAGRVLAAVVTPAAVERLVEAYNEAIARVVERNGAVLVDLHAVGMAARAAGTEAQMISADGFHPSNAGHAAVAAAFADALRRSGPLTVPSG